MLEELKNTVFKANLRLKESGLVILTWGNASQIDRESGLVVIKPSGIPYDAMTPNDMVTVDLNGNVVDGNAVRHRICIRILKYTSSSTVSAE